MVLGIIEDFSSNAVLDTELTAIPTSGMYLNSGVHTSITVNNLLSFLPFDEVSISAWSNATTYGKYTTTRKRSDLVTYDGKVWQSLTNNNVNNTPASGVNWLETNFNSLKLKNFIFKVQDKVYSDLNLTKRLINNQFLYQDKALTATQLPNDYSAWVFEPKGSDYVSITINQISLSKSGTTPVNLYVINQGILVDTLEITPSNGIVDFKDLNYTFKGKGKWIFAIDSTEVFAETAFVDPLAFDGIVCYTATGIGDEPETANYTYSTTGNGLGFNISVSLDADLYIENNLSLLANFVRATFELVTLEMFLHNSENRSNRSQVIQMDREALIAETKSLDLNTVARRYSQEYAKAKRLISKTFDTQLFLNDDNGFEITSV